MNISFFLTPKRDTVWIDEKSSVRQAMEKMEHYRYAAVPIVDGEGKYVGTLTEGDLLWYLKNRWDLSFRDLSRISLSEVVRHKDNRAVPISYRIEDLFVLAFHQTFVPVVDDVGVFIGIVKRSSILKYLYEVKRPSAANVLVKTREKAPMNGVLEARMGV